MIIEVTSDVKHIIKHGGFAALRDRLLGNKTVKVGFQAGPVEKNGVATAAVAFVHEFGSPSENIPERSFMRSGIIEGERQQIALNKANLVKVLRDELNMSQALGQLGELAKGQIQHKITEGPFTPLRPSTIAARLRKLSPGYRKKIINKANARQAAGEDVYKPLIDTGHMRASVTWVLNDD